MRKLMRVTASKKASEYKPNKMSNVMVARYLAKQLKQYADNFIAFVELFEDMGLENLEDDTADILAANVYERVQDLLSEFEPRLQEIENEMRQLESIVMSYTAEEYQRDDSTPAPGGGVVLTDPDTGEKSIIR